MKKGLKSLGLLLLTIMILTSSAFAADPAVMTDISGHWAESYINWVLENELYLGTSDNTFSPDDTMTRSMFVTVLGRLAGVNPADYQDGYLSNLYSDVPTDVWYAPYVNWATRYGITNGTGGGVFRPEDPITREQIATLVERYAANFGLSITTVPDSLIADSFTDGYLVSDFAIPAVDKMRSTGVLNGKSNGDGTYSFDPLAYASRSECAAVFCRLSGALVPGAETVEPELVELDYATLTLKVGQTGELCAAVYPENATNKTVTWVSSDPGVVTVTGGSLYGVSEGTADIYCYGSNGCYAVCGVTVERNVSLAYAGETYGEKCDRIFGEYLSRSEYRNYYTSSSEAMSHMTTIAIQAWDFTDSTCTEKYTRTFYLTVHENIADTVQAVFDEIYNGEEQFPINSIGGYRWDYDSEHTIGVAIDINPNENYYINYKTGQTVGSYWKPYEDPYSIPTDGEVARIFNKYGFTQGIWSSSADYMHFSYFGW